VIHWACIRSSCIGFRISDWKEDLLHWLLRQLESNESLGVDPIEGLRFLSPWFELLGNSRLKLALQRKLLTSVEDPLLWLFFSIDCTREVSYPDCSNY
jgi:hypothetical protein